MQPLNLYKVKSKNLYYNITPLVNTFFFFFFFSN